jgi:hypothetical protein
MNQLDWEKMQEKTEIADVERVTRSWWFTSESEYTVNVGSHLNGTDMDTWSVDNVSEAFREELAPLCYNPSGYIPGGLTKYISGSTADLVTDNEAYMVFRSYSSAFSSQTLYAHQETTTIGGSTYYLSKLTSADASGTTLSADTSSTGRKLMGKFVYQLTGVSSIPASTWTLYYRAMQNHGNIVAHCDVDILIRQANGTVRTTIASNVASSANFPNTNWNTLSGTYAWAAYTVVNGTDYLEIDYYIHVTESRNNKAVSLMIDNNALATGDLTRATNIYLPSEYTSEVEFTGSSNTGNWYQLVWTVDSAWTTDSVSVTIQVYNYTLDQYPTSGSGYDSYTSSATPNTDEHRTQTITTNATSFRDAWGNWKIKVKGVKATTTQFDFKVDWAEFKVKSQNSYALDVTGEFVLDLSTFPLAYIHSIEIQIRYRANDSLEYWCLKAYNWTQGEYGYTGFNSTEHLPATEFAYYAVNLTNAWQSYVQNNNGTMRIKFGNKVPDANQTTIDIDFLGVIIDLNGVKFHLQNEGSTTSHIVAVWIINATTHTRYAANLFLNAGEKADYLRADICLPTDSFIAKVVTERGNIAVFRND